MIIIEQKAKTNVINDIICTTKIFDGDVFGSAIRDYRICGNTNIPDIDIRLDNNHFKPFVTLLHTKYNVQILPAKIYNGVTIECFKLSPKQSTQLFFPIKLDIVLMNRHLFKISFIDLDVNLLTENEKALFVRLVPHTLKYLPDKISFIKDRIISKTFSYIPMDRQLPDLCAIVDKCARMTYNNWCMDDLNHSNDTWVVGKWEGFVNGRHRKMYNNEKYKKLVEGNTCSLCHEKFNPNDVVLNTACNHSFHWNCNQTNGLALWAKEHSSCPYCRSEMFTS